MIGSDYYFNPKWSSFKIEEGEDYLGGRIIFSVSINDIRYFGGKTEAFNSKFSQVIDTMNLRKTTYYVYGPFERIARHRSKLKKL